MKHRHPIRIAATIVSLTTVLLLGSCYWNPQGSGGKITLNLNSPGRTQVDPSAVLYARVYLYANNMNSDINISDGKPYAETTMTSGGGSVTVDHVPAGSGYRLVLTLGSKPDGTTYVPGQFGWSGSFDVTAGHETDVTIPSMSTVGTATGSLSAPEYDSTLLGKNVTGVATTVDGNGNVWIAAIAGNTIYRGQAFPLSSASGGMPGGVTADSVSEGNGEFLVNSTGGIVPFALSGAYGVGTVFPQSAGPATGVTQSGYNANTLLANLFQLNNFYSYRTADGGLGGVTTTTSNVSKNFVVDLSSGASKQVVVDAAMNSADDPFTYLATTAGAYVVSPEIFSPGNNNFAYLSTYGANLSVHTGGRNLFISTVAVDSNQQLVYAGTDSGLYVAPTSAISSAVGLVSSGPGQKVDLLADAGGSLVPLTGGHPISKVVAQTQYAQIAAISNSLLFLYISYNSPPTVVIPLAAVTLGTLNSIAISPSSGVPFVVIAGTEGLTLVPVLGGG